MSSMQNRANLSLREWDHMRICQVCQNLWPLYMNYEMTNNEASLQTLCDKWSNMTEKERESLLPQLQKESHAHIKNILYHRSPSPYHVFLSKHMRDIEGTFTTRIQALSSRWGLMSSQERAEYTEVSNHKKEQRQNVLRHLTLHQKRALKVSKKLHRLKRKQKQLLLNIPSKPVNKFMLYLNDRWSDEKKKSQPSSYQKIMRCAAHDWKNVLQPCERDQYKKRADTLREEYLLQKQQASAANTLVEAECQFQRQGQDACVSGTLRTMSS